MPQPQYGLVQRPAERVPHTARVLTSPAPPIDDEARQGALEQVLLATPREVRALINKLRISIPVYAEEFGAGNVGDLGVTPQRYSSNIILVTAVVVVTPSGTTAASLTLGTKTMAIPFAQAFVVNSIESILLPNDVRKLTFAPALTVPNSAFLWIMGEQKPEVAL